MVGVTAYITTDVGGWDGLKDEIVKMKGNDELLQSWAGTGSGAAPKLALSAGPVGEIGFLSGRAATSTAPSAKSLIIPAVRADPRTL